MKYQYSCAITGILLFFSFLSKAQLSANGNSGVWQTFGDALSTSMYPQIEGRLCNFYWKDLEPSPNVWKWDKFDSDLASRTKDGLPVILMVFTKEDAPQWLYSNGVPKVNEKDSKDSITGYSPYYADDDYKFYFKRMIQKVHAHIETLSASVRNKIVGVQACFGNTGDYIGYKGTVPTNYALTGSDFYALFQEFTQYYYDEYKNTNPHIAVMSNPSNSGNSQTLWVVQNCPGGWLKNGTLGKGYQLNDELSKREWLYPILNVPQSGSIVRSRSEIIGGNLSSGWWKSVPYQNMFTMFCYAIFWGLDWSNQSYTQINDGRFTAAFSFFDKYAGQKNPATSTNAMCALKDVLDASDNVRFSAADYGNISRTNTQRYKNIANAYAAYGAKLEDLNAANLTEQDNINASGINDVGWNLLPGNYDRYLHQITPNESSVGYWNVKCADKNSMYGRFARGFDIAYDKKALFFDVDDAFLGNKPLQSKYPVTISITYLDNGGGGFKLYYDGATNKSQPSIKVTCGNTNQWKTATVTLKDANFGNNGNKGSDFKILSTNDANVIFSIIELSRPQNFADNSASSQSSSATALVNSLKDDNNKKLQVYPNPVQQLFSVSLDDSQTIQTIAIYNEAGKLVMQKNVSASKLMINKNEIGNTAGLYFVKVFADKKVYITKIIVL